MTKKEIVERLATRARLTKKDAEEFADILFEELAAAVRKDGRAAWPDFGVFSVRSRKSRQIRNPQTRELMQLEMTKTIGFRTAGGLKRSLRDEPEREPEEAGQGREDALRELQRDRAEEEGRAEASDASRGDAH
jgi:DNA-binding protein HU-beta